MVPHSFDAQIVYSDDAKGKHQSHGVTIDIEAYAHNIDLRFDMNTYGYSQFSARENAMKGLRWLRDKLDNMIANGVPEATLEKGYAESIHTITNQQPWLQPGPIRCDSLTDGEGI